MSYYSPKIQLMKTCFLLKKYLIAIMVLYFHNCRNDPHILEFKSFGSSIKYLVLYFQITFLKDFLQFRWHSSILSSYLIPHYLQHIIISII